MNRATALALLANSRRAGNPAAARALTRAAALLVHQRRDGTEPVAVTIPHLRVENPRVSAATPAGSGECSTGGTR